MLRQIHFYLDKIFDILVSYNVFYFMKKLILFILYKKKCKEIKAVSAILLTFPTLKKICIKVFMVVGK